MNRDEQIRAILLSLKGAPPASLPQNLELDEPLRRIYQLVRKARSRAEAILLLTEAAGPEGLEIAKEIIGQLPPGSAFPARAPLYRSAARREADEPDERFLSLQEIPARSTTVDWLWPSWIPRGMVTLLAAAPGVGKSLVALDLARRITKGEPFPDGSAVPEPGRAVVVVDAEGAPELLRQRAKAWQINTKLLFPMRPPKSSLLIDLSSSAEAKRLLALCRAVNPALVIVDSLASAAPRSETSLKSARDVLAGLSMIAQALGHAVLVIHHLRKGRAGEAGGRRLRLADLRGSSHLTAVARSVLGLSHEAPDSDLLVPADPNGPRRLEVIKSNLCPLPPPLRLELEQEPGAPTLRYSPLIESPPPPTMLRLCAEWLLGYLAEAGGSVRPADAIAAAAGAGFPQATLYRARRALGAAIAESGSGPYDPNKKWALAPTGNRV